MKTADFFRLNSYIRRDQSIVFGIKASNCLVELAALMMTGMCLKKRVLVLSGSCNNHVGRHARCRIFWVDCLFGIWQLYRNSGIYRETVLVFNGGINRIFSAWPTWTKHLYLTIVYPHLQRASALFCNWKMVFLILKVTFLDFLGKSWILTKRCLLIWLVWSYDVRSRMQYILDSRYGKKIKI